MKKSTKWIILGVDALTFAFLVTATALFMNGWSIPVRAGCYAAWGLLFGACILSMAIDKQAFFKSCFLLILLAAVLLGALIAMNVFWHLDDYPTSEEKIEQLVAMIRETGAWSMLVYILIQILQVIILPLPAVVCYVPGSIIFGPFLSTVLASAGVILGSVASYFIGKIFGRKVVDWIAGKEVTEKYVSYMGKRGRILFVLMQILPFFPDDLLCMVAGLSGIGFPFFLVTIVIVRPFIIAAYCYLGSGTIIPFEGWGIAVWIVIFLLCILLAVLSFRYQDRIEKWLTEKFHRTRKEEHSVESESSDLTESEEE